MPVFYPIIKHVTEGGGGGSSVSPKDVNFYDYDGTLLHSYTVAEAQALTELPPLPEQEGLICQGWNWTLEDIKAENKEVDVGATYITDDGKTRLYVEIAADGRMEVALSFYQDQLNGIVIDWGDGSATETVGNSNYAKPKHTYSSVGDYVITLDPIDGCTLQLGGKNVHSVMGGHSSAPTLRAYPNMLKKAELGRNVSFKETAFYICPALRTVTLPKGIADIELGAFQGCYSLLSIVIPNGVKTIGNRSLYTCRSLKVISMPNGLTSIDDQAFYQCVALSTVTVPNSVTTLKGWFDGSTTLARASLPSGITTIFSNAFNLCYCLSKVVIPNGVTIIPQKAFYYCEVLPSIEIPNSVATIEANAFYQCYSLTSVVIPNSVTTIGSASFGKCTSVKYYDFTSHTAVPAIQSTSFTSLSNDCEIRVPASLYNEWIAATNWSNFTDYIVPV